jgi:hypothetical protein
MKKLTYIGIIMAMGILICAVNLFAESGGYLASESSSRGLIISQEAKQEAMQARADRMLLYQDEISALDADSLELQASMRNDEENPDDSIAEPPDIEPGSPGCTAGEDCDNWKDLVGPPR